MQTLLKGFAISLLLLLTAPAVLPPAYAQTATLRFERISTEQGLSQNTVTAILQDRQGFLWFGTEGGLNRYDGYQFTVFQHDPDSTQSLADNSVASLYEDHTGALWIGTANGLDRYDPASGTFVHYTHKTNDPTSLGGSFVQAICEDRTGLLWIGAQDGGLDLFDQSTGRFTHYRHAADDPQSLSDDTVQTIYQDQDGSLWIGTNSGLDRFDRSTGKFAHYRQSPYGAQVENDYTVLSILEHRGDLWIGTRGGLIQMDRRSGQSVEYHNNPGDDSSLGSDSVAFLYEDTEGTLWLGGRAGLDRLEDGQNGFVHYRYDQNDPHSLSSDYVRSIYQDRSGVLWVGTSDGGLSKYSPSGQKFALYQSHPGVSSGLSDNNVWAVHEDREGILWVGTFFKGLNALDLRSGASTLYQHSPNKPESLLSDEIRVITEDSAGNLWVGSEHGGLDRLDRGTGTFVHYRHDPNNPQSLSDDDVFAIYEDRDHRLWVGTQNGGLNRLNGSDGTFVHYLHNPNDPASLSNNYVGSIYQDKSGRLWVGTLGGLDLWDAGRDGFVHYRHDPRDPSSLSTDMVASTVEDASGFIWVGTFGGGLNRFDPSTQSFTHFTAKNGLPDDTVYGILPDGHGFLWVSTNKGLSRFDPRSATFRNYTPDDGLQGNQFNPRASFESPAGEMFFGGVQGLNAFYPDQVRDNTYAPPVVITAFTKLNQPAKLDLTSQEPVQLTYQDYVISFEFAALDFNAPDKNQYAYKLEGVDPDWVYAGTRRYASYTNLSGGDYVFWLKASNSDGVWGQPRAMLTVHVAPPIWETWWFRGALALVLVMGVAGAYWIRMRGMQARRRELETQVEQRTSDLVTLNSIAAVVGQSLNLKEIMSSALAKTMQAYGMDTGSALELEEDSQTLVLITQKGLTDEFAQRTARLPLQLALAGRALDLDHPMTWQVHQDYPEGELKDAVLREGVRSIFAVLLMARGKFVGALVLSSKTPRVLTAEESSMLSAVGRQVGIAIENAHLYEQAQQLAATAERTRLARELHDSVTQSLYSVTLFAQAAVETLAEGETQTAKEHLIELRDTVQEALREMRLLIFQLRPPAAEKGTLAAALRTRLEAVETRGGMQAELHVEGSEQLTRMVHEELYNIAQEALNNALKYARAQHVQVYLRFGESLTSMEVCDDGAGFEPEIARLGGGFGISGMQERVERIGGTLRIESAPGQGTRVRVQVPRNPSAPPEVAELPQAPGKVRA
jgi:signal transduction histidine kinase/ligand-binding sensor domain-containing protein